MTLWRIIPGKDGEFEDTMLENHVIALGGNKIGDLIKMNTWEELREEFKQAYQIVSNLSAGVQAGNLWRLLNEVKVGDHVALALKSQSSIVIGEVKGPYSFNPRIDENCPHVRNVAWLSGPIPRILFPHDILYSFNALIALCGVYKPNAEDRVLAVMRSHGQPAPELVIEEVEEVEQSIDIVQTSTDQILTQIQENFRKHRMATLVEAILQAQGYFTMKMPPGPDGGVDILAGEGNLGFDGMKMCVQVKTSLQPSNVNIYRALVGTMEAHGAEQGLLVSWGGFTRDVEKEAKQAFFKVRLWGQDELLEMIFKQYDRLPEDIRVDLPLKRIWILAKD